MSMGSATRTATVQPVSYVCTTPNRVRSPVSLRRNRPRPDLTGDGLPRTSVELKRYDCRPQQFQAPVLAAGAQLGGGGPRSCRETPNHIELLFYSIYPI